MDVNRSSRWMLLILAAAVLPVQGASYSKRENGDSLFAAPVRIQIEIPKDSMEVLRAYNQVWRQTRPERVDAKVTVREGGKTYTNVAVHLKGSFSFQPMDGKPSLTLNFDKFAPGQKFHGLTKIHLNNSVQDVSYLSEQLGRELFNSIGVPAPRAGHALVSINGRPVGLYVIIEGANRNWVKRNFDSAKGNLYDGGSGGDIGRALEVDSGDNPEDRSDLVKLRAAIKEKDVVKRYALLSEILDMEQFINFAATELLIGHWDGYTAGGNNYRLFHDVSRDKMVFIPGGLDQLFGVSSDPRYSITPPFKGTVAKALFAYPVAKQRYLNRIAELSTNEFRVEKLHARVDALAARVRPALKDEPALLNQFNRGAQNFKGRISARAQSVAEQLRAPTPQPVELAPGSELRFPSWTYKGGTTFPATQSRLTQNGRQILQVTGRGPGSSGSYRCAMLLGPGHYKFTGLARTQGIQAQPGETNGVILRVSGERSVEGITISEQWKELRYEFEVGAGSLEDVEFACEFRGAQGSGFFDASTLRLVRKEP